MNLVKWLVGGITAILIALGFNYFFNPPMNEKQEEEHWARQDAILEAQLRTQEIQERLSEKKDKLNTGDKSLIAKAREEWEKE